MSTILFRTFGQHDFSLIPQVALVPFTPVWYRSNSTHAPYSFLYKWLTPQSRGVSFLISLWPFDIFFKFGSGPFSPCSNRSGWSASSRNADIDT
jgi:hypothetical protein